jgi:hypothetical protein
MQECTRKGKIEKGSQSGFWHTLAADIGKKSPALVYKKYLCLSQSQFVISYLVDCLYQLNTSLKYTSSCNDTSIDMVSTNIRYRDHLLHIQRNSVITITVITNSRL